MNHLPVYPVRTTNGVPMGIGAVAMAAANKRERLDLRDLPNAPNASSPTPR